MTRAPTLNRNEAGFTLIELLVTVTLLSLLLLLLFGGLRFGTRAWDGAQAHGVRTDELRLVQDLLRREIEQAYPAYDITDPVHPVVDFRGDEDDITFLAPAPQAVGEGGRSRITIRGERSGGALQLAIRATPELAASQDGAWSAPLLRNVAAVRFSYFGDGRWNASWTNRNALPDLIRVHLTFAPGDGRVWPDLIVAPRIGMDAGCIYDFGSKRCQGRS